MLAVAKVPHINFEAFGEGLDIVVEILKREVPDIVITPDPDSACADDTELVDIRSTDWYREMKDSWHAGITLRIRRENSGMTQQELSEKTGIAVPNISLMEAGKRPIGFRTAKKLGSALHVDFFKFLET